jgi:hypothetical protein
MINLLNPAHFFIPVYQYVLKAFLLGDVLTIIKITSTHPLKKVKFEVIEISIKIVIIEVKTK